MILKASVGLFLTALFASMSSAAYARGPAADSIFSFNAFGTLGVVHATQETGDFTLHALQAEGAGYTSEWSTKVDSRIGAQLSAQVTPDLSAVLQVVSEQRYDASFRPAVDWATLKYQVTPDLSVRVGRIILPLLLYSDNYKVGYAQHWLRAPVEVYRLLPMTSSDGVDMIYHFGHGEFKHALHLAYGENSRNAPEGGKARIRDGWLVSDTVEIGDLTLHATLSGSRLTLDVPGYNNLFGGFKAIAQGQLPGDPVQAQAIVDKYNPRNRRTTFTSIGASYDPGKWFVITEAGQINSKSIFGNRFAWYATGGYRLGAFVPYLTYSQAKARSPLSDPGVTGAPSQLNAGLNTALSYVPEQKTLSIGTRWDAARNIALKVQYDRSRIGEGSSGTLQTIQTPQIAPATDKFSVFSLSLDWVF